MDGVCDETFERNTSTGGFGTTNPLAEMTLQTMVDPPSRDVDAVLTDLLLCAPEQPPVPLADEVFGRVNTSAADLKETYLGRKEDVEGYFF